jgi:hypothetical protein
LTNDDLGSANASAAARTWTSGWRRTSGALALALAICLGVYLLLESVRPDSGLVSFSFLVISPAAICAFASYIADPWGERRRATYLWIPVWILVAVAVVSFVALREGVICILLLAPLWLISGIAGSALTYSVRHRLKRGRTYCAALLVAPLVAMQIEPLVTLPDARFVVSRSAVVHASPERIWPLLRGIPDVLPGEGKWNVTQDVIGVPRPLGARLIGNGIGADRYARWAHGLRFREQITDWSQDRRIGWRFIFERTDGWEYTDRHLVPNSPYFRIEEGGYSLEPIDSTHTRLTLRTQYWIQTPVNFYCAWWGELLLGDLSDNLLALVKNRAENTRLGRGLKVI